MPETMSREAATTTARAALAGFASEAELAALDESAPLRATLELDSIDFLTFVERLSTAAGRRIEETDYPRLATLASCAEFLMETTA
ncbi:acyl carrier protein [Nocardia blacklockiae]|uniref:acyl carrier protein n=1 Tax=Nocardia blacklockiae TaxID=480036 RepID=UPI0018947FA9|nr:acyl carrier protein [Nocardia blacklockiae]MBF6176621.1 acyl carrier protein [Nocardia blacklockiae]